MSINYELKPREAAAMLFRYSKAGLTAFIRSSPGCGKSSIVHQLAKRMNLFLIDNRASTSNPVDFAGLPTIFHDKAKFMPFEDMVPTEHTPIPEGYNGFLIFFDEMNHATKAVQSALYKVLLDRKSGGYNVHPKSIIVCAGNLDTDKANTTPLSTALQSRLAHIHMVTDLTQWIEDVGIPQDFDRRILNYLSYCPDALMDFRPDHNDRTFCCPRTWEFTNRLIKGVPTLNAINDGAALAGVITSGQALSFIEFCNITSPVTIQDILRDSAGCRIGADKRESWVITNHLCNTVKDKETFNDVIPYVLRMGVEFKVLFIRSCLRDNPLFRQTEGFDKAMLDVGRYFQ